jgi:hypothetical protein
MNLSGDIELPKWLRTAGVLEAHLTLLRPLSGDDTRFSLKRGAGMVKAGGFALPDNKGEVGVSKNGRFKVASSVSLIDPLSPEDSGREREVNGLV